MSILKPVRSGPPRETRTGKLAAEAALRLREAIVRGELKAGQPLREVELCQTFGISRIPLREALHQLVGEGLVETVPNRGSMVASMTPHEVGQIAEICALLEGQLLRTAVPGLTAEIVEQAEDLIEEMDRTEDVVDWFRINWRFHSVLYQPAERPMFVDLVGKQRARADRYIYVLARDPARRAALNVEHRAILAACRARDVEKAATLLGQHLVSGKDQVVQLLAASQADSQS